MSLLDAVRPRPPREFLITGAHHTPSGHLHLGHLGGPFLGADLVARQLEVLGHQVTRIGSTDAHEAHVLFAAGVEGRSPAEVAHEYTASAREILAAFDLHYDAFIELNAPPWRRGYHAGCHEIATEMLRRERLTVTPVELPRGRSGRFLVGPFAAGRCPVCTAAAVGSSCEECGLWFGPGELDDVRARFADEEIAEWVEVPTVFLKIAEELTADAVAERFPPGYAELFRRYVQYNGRYLPLTHPLGWGVGWKAHQLGPEVVHVSYGTGSYATTQLIGGEYQRLTGARLSPFHRESEVTTILTSGFDAALPSMMVMAFKDEQSSFEPFRAHVMNRFLLLEGSKFSTTRDHVILGSAYLDAKLPPDLFRFYAATLNRPDREGDFVPARFSAWVSDFLAGRLDRACVAALERLSANASPEPLDPADGARIAAALSEQAAALGPPEASPQAASATIAAWLAAGEERMIAAAPYWWLRALAVLAYPLMPRWSRSLWRCLGDSGTPSVERIELGLQAQPRAFVPAAAVDPARLAQFARNKGGGNG